MRVSIGMLEPRKRLDWTRAPAYQKATAGAYFKTRDSHASATVRVFVVSGHSLVRLSGSENLEL